MARKPATIGRKAITKQERVYGILRERIQTGTYRPGHRIVVDQLAAEFGVSALPVREAVRRVQAEGLVVFRRNSGACVTPAEPELVDSMAELLAVVEGYATSLAAPHCGSSAGR
jgi:DNA-binding GntR family transcriptional regulator